MEKLIFDVKDFKFIDDDEEADASVSLNPTFRWCKFILTDDQPNKNKRRVPQDEFDNLIQTGIFAPIKMAVGEIKPGHDDSMPLGVITALKKENNYIQGLAALWSKERPEDVEFVKKSYDEGKPLQLSWEILYSELVAEDNGVEALKGTALRATTFVGMPAYAGRTPVLEVASTDEEATTTLEEKDLDRIEELEAKVEELTQSLATKTTELETVVAEKEALAQFKADVEKEQANSAKLLQIKTKFTEAGIGKDETYFTENSEKLLSLDENTLDFMVQELVAFAAAHKDTEDKSSTNRVPNFTSDNTSFNAKELGRQLRLAK